MYSRGFTLIELSIVLVILGLIVGGIVGGKSLIHQAELQSVIREMNGYKTIIGAFYTQYDSMPGDFKEGYAYWGATCGDNTTGGWASANGNGDGYVEGSEAIIAWKQMYHADLLPEVFTNDTSTNLHHPKSACGQSGAASCPNGSMPGSKFGNTNGWVIVHTRQVDYGGQPSGFEGTGIYGYFGHALYYSSHSTNTMFQLGGAMTPKDASALDKKLDNGSAMSGGVQSNFIWWAEPYATISGDNGTYCNWNGSALTDAYNVADVDPLCSMWFTLPY